MKSTILKVFMCIAMLATAFSNLHAQEIITVSGKILSQPEGKSKPEPFPAWERVYIFAFHTVAAAKDAMQLLEAGDPNVMSDATEFAGSDGYYEIRVAENGALVICAAMKNTLIEVKGRTEINHNVIFLDLVRYWITTPSKRFIHIKPSKIIGNNLCLDNEIHIPENYTGLRRRLILMPYVLDCVTEDTIAFLDTMVIDGMKYIPPRKKLANKKKGDPLGKYVNPNRTMGKESFSIRLRDTINMVNPDRNYAVFTKIKIEDYTHIVYEDDLRLTTCKSKRPFLFIEPIDTTNRSLKEAYHQCLHHDFDYRKSSNMQELERRKKMFELVKNSSPMNHAVMCMAMETPVYDKEAKEVLEQMKQTTQIKYMKLQLFIREKKLHDDPKFVEPFSDEEEAFKEACRMLDAIIKEDPKYRKIAENDGEITNEFMEYFADPFNWDDSMMYDF